MIAYMNAFFRSLSPPTGNNAQRDYYTIRDDIGRAKKRMRIQHQSKFRSTNPVLLLCRPPQFRKLFECEQTLFVHIMITYSKKIAGLYLLPVQLYGMIGQSETDSAVTLNRVYYSTPSNDLRLSSKVGSSDTFNCTWATIPLEITSQFQRIGSIVVCIYEFKIN
jgi:hypothetical protein